MKSTNVVRRLAGAFASLLLTAMTLLLLASSALPRIVGYRTMTVLTGSMSPVISTGSVIVDAPEPVSSLAVGQVITYRVPVADQRIETHRVSWVGRGKDGAVVFRTRGDRNPTEDPWTTRVSEPTVWRVRMVIPTPAA